MRLFDCVTFFNELDLLELRLEELDSVVDRFVIAESPLTFTGKAKPLLFAENRERFTRFLPKIEHVVVSDMPDGEGITAWDREWFQRRALSRGLGVAAWNDLVLVSDIDEIPKPSVLAAVKADPRSPSRLTVMESEAHFYFLNTRPANRYFSQVQAPRIVARRYADDPQKIRAFRTSTSKKAWLKPVQPALRGLRALAQFGAPLETCVMPQSAWHFTFLGGAQSVREKMLAYSHTEYATAENVAEDALEKRIEDRRFLWGFDKLVDVAIDETFPESLRRDQAKWRHLMAPSIG